MSDRTHTNSEIAATSVKLFRDEALNHHANKSAGEPWMLSLRFENTLLGVAALTLISTFVAMYLAIGYSLSVR